MAKMRNIIKSTAEYTESFSGFRGIAPEGNSSVKSRLAYCENVFRDYESDTPSAIVSVPGYRRLAAFGSSVEAMLSHFGDILVQSGGSLYSLDGEGGTPKSRGSLPQKLLCSFPFEDHTYILDGERVRRLYKRLDADTVLDAEPPPYVPTLYLNGERLEARNLLTDSTTEEFDVVDGRELEPESDKLRYSITDAEAFTCAVSGADAGLSGEVFIPGRKRIGGVLYRVDEIADSAFRGNTEITSVKIGEGVRRIGKMSFFGCDGIRTVSTPSTLNVIDDTAFNSCPSLSEVYLRGGLYRIGAAAFAASLSLNRVYYEGTAEELSKIEGVEAIGAAEKLYGTVDESLSLYLPLNAKFDAVELVTVDGASVDFEVKIKEGAPCGITLRLEKHWQYNGSRLCVSGRLPELFSSFNGSDEGGDISGRGLIEGCTVAALYDGRVFLAGNPKLPGTVFYCSRTRFGEASALYFGEHNYFNDGSKGVAVSALLSVGDGLYVFKKENDPMGSIFFHKGEDTGIDVLPRIYPVYDAFSGESCHGAAVAAADAPLFISPRGLCAIEKQATNLERDICLRSSNVTSRLLGERLSEAQLFDWMGYIAVCSHSRIYLADTRATFTGRNNGTEYEWFIINGVGAYLGKKQVYRYCSYVTDPELSLSPEYADLPVDTTVYSYAKDGKTFYFTYGGETRYAVYPTEEYGYTDFMAAEKYLAVDGRLYFTANGTVFVFNNDMRSVPLSEDYLIRMGITEAEYREIYGRRLHPSLYSFDGIAPRYVIKTVKTDCGVPHLTKSTVKSSLTVKLGRATVALPTCKATTDKGKYSEFVSIGGRALCFLDIDFARLSLNPEMDQTVAVAEKEKDWIEKDIAIYSEAPSSPISLHGISFRYKIKGRIKHT
ncbi:MAG: leucine-rich repeat domain-containing protein [Clostridia bacterium]|nr:leucine-rich repeat domain-containing protein [Clostridia bacterium]